MKTCSTCKHWLYKAVGEGRYAPAQHVCTPIDPDTFKAMKLPFEVRRCLHPSKTFCERPVEANGFGVCDGSDYMAELVTGPEFGCVRHEAA